MEKITPEDEVNEEDLANFLEKQMMVMIHDMDEEDARKKFLQELPVNLNQTEIDTLVSEMDTIHRKIEEEKHRMQL